jgi:hypothetical protein
MSVNKKAMKNFLLLPGLVFFFWAAPANGEPAPRSVRLSVHFAYNNSCELCNEEGEFIVFFNEVTGDFPDRPESFFTGYNVFRAGAEQQFYDACARLGIDGRNLPLPVLIIGDGYLVGDDAIREGTRDLFFRQAEAAITDPVPIGTTAAGTGNGAAAVRPAYPEVNSEASTLVFFGTIACESCEKTRDYLGRLPAEVTFGLNGASPLDIHYFNVTEPGALAAARQFFEAYAVPEEDQIVPVIFYRDGYLSGYANIQSGLPGVLYTGKAVGFSYPGSGGEIAGLTWLELPAVFLAGLLGGVNPCSISMLLLLLSLLAAKNAGILKLGLSYVASKLITYLALGLALFTLIKTLDSAAFRTAQAAVRWVIIVLSLGLCVFNIIDLVNARRENYGAIKVQLPRALRRFNNSFIKKVVEGGDPRFLMAAIFLLGVVVSAGEFLCTGQIYLATILYLLRTSTGSFLLTLGAFLCYTVAAALPPALLVILCYKGKKAMALSDLVRRKMPLIKLANALLFAFFAVYAFFYF